MTDQHFVDVRRLNATGPGASQITVGFVRRHKINNEDWQYSLDNPFGSYDWALTPKQRGRSIKQRKIAWNTIEAMRTGPQAPEGMEGIEMGGGRGLRETTAAAFPLGKAYKGVDPSWWDMIGMDPNVGKPYEDKFEIWGKKIGGTISSATSKSAKELRDIIDWESSMAAQMETGRSASNAEEIWTEFFMEALMDELKDSGKTDLPAWFNKYKDYAQQSKTRNADEHIQLINMMGMDFAGYSDYEQMENALFGEIMDDVMGDNWDGDGGNLLDDDTVVFGREQTSDVGGKFFARGISESIQGGRSVRGAFFEQTAIHVDQIFKKLSQYDDITKAIWEIGGNAAKTPEQGRGAFENLDYIAKQTADRALMSSLASMFSQGGVKAGGKAAYDYYLPLPARSAGGHRAGSWLGQIRLLPIIDEEKDGSTVTFRLKALNFATRVFETGIGGAGTQATPVSAILKHLIGQNVLNASQVSNIKAAIRLRYETHVSASGGIAESGGIFYGHLMETSLSEQMGGAAAQITISNIAMPESIAQSVRGQIENYFGDGGATEKAFAAWFKTMGHRVNELTASWRKIMGSVFKAREKWAKSNP